MARDRLRRLGIDAQPDVPCFRPAPENVELHSRHPQSVTDGPEMPALHVAGVHRMPGSGSEHRRVGVPATAPHGLQRTCAKLCRAEGGEVEQIQMLPGHVSAKTTERYLGTRRSLVNAPNDGI